MSKVIIVASDEDAKPRKDPLDPLAEKPADPLDDIVPPPPTDPDAPPTKEMAPSPAETPAEDNPFDDEQATATEPEKPDAPKTPEWPSDDEEPLGKIPQDAWKPTGKGQEPSQDEAEVPVDMSALEEKAPPSEIDNVNENMPIKSRIWYAINNFMPLRIVYTSLGGMTTERTIHPDHPYWSMGTNRAILVAWDELRNDWRAFIIDSIRDAKLMKGEK